MFNMFWTALQPCSSLRKIFIGEVLQIYTKSEANLIIAQTSPTQTLQYFQTHQKYFMEEGKCIFHVA